MTPTNEELEAEIARLKAKCVVTYMDAERLIRFKAARLQGRQEQEAEDKKILKKVAEKALVENFREIIEEERQKAKLEQKAEDEKEIKILKGFDVRFMTPKQMDDVAQRLRFRVLSYDKLKQLESEKAIHSERERIIKELNKENERFKKELEKEKAELIKAVTNMSGFRTQDGKVILTEVDTNDVLELLKGAGR